MKYIEVLIFCNNKKGQSTRSMHCCVACPVVADAALWRAV